jgi:parallel beta-helix repeat protein
MRRYYHAPKKYTSKEKRLKMKTAFWRICKSIMIVVLGLSIVQAKSVSSKSASVFVRQVRVIGSEDTGVLNPGGIAFSSGGNVFHVFQGRDLNQSLSGYTDISELSPSGKRAGLLRIAAAIPEPINMVYDGSHGRLLALGAGGRQMLELEEDSTGRLNPGLTSQYDVRGFGLQDPQGMTVDEKSGTLYILDAPGPQIVRVIPALGGSISEGQTSVVVLSWANSESLRGIAYDPTSGHLFVLNPMQQKLIELTTGGVMVAERELDEFELIDPHGLVFAPSGDQTDDPTQMSLYIADSGKQQVRASHNGKMVASLENMAITHEEGQIVELSLVEPPAAASSFTSTLVKTTDLSAISPPSPDPSGLMYNPLSNRLIMVDGEVEETVSGITHFQGTNLWELTLGGSVARTANISYIAPTVVPMTNEPVGIAWNPSNGHYYISDDSTNRVYDLNIGGDGLIGTNDDSWTYFSTAGSGNNDPEGLTFDTWNNRIFVADGVNAEVYEYTLSGNYVNNFDVNAFGVMDPESIEFNTDSGTLFVMSGNKFAPIIVETTLTGQLLQTIDISAANYKHAAGLAYAPASNGSGAKRFYIVDRGIDNNSNPNIIDGKMYEMTAPSSGPTPTPTKTKTPTPTSTATNPPGSLDSNRASINFGEQLYYIKSDPFNTTLINNQATNVHIGSFIRSSGQFLLSNNTCAGATLTPGQSCSFVMQFKPTAYGALPGTLTINSDASNSPMVLPLAGTGLSGTQLVTQGGSFEQDNDNNGIPDFWNTTGLTGLDGRSNQFAKHGFYSMKFAGQSGVTKTLKQTIMKNGSAGDDFLYVLWSKAQNAPSGFKYRTQVSFYNGNVLVEQRIKDYAAGTHDWEYKWLPITVSGDYTRIEVEIIYSLSSGTVWFDSCSLKWAP